MKIGIIGAGHIGSVLAQKLSSLNHEIKIANSRGPETLGEVAKKTGAKPVYVEDVVKDVELVVITIPEKNIVQLPKGLFGNVSDSVVVVDTCNYYPDIRDGVIADLERAPSESTWVAEKIGRRVIKVFNNIPAFSLESAGLPFGTQGRIGLPISGDNFEAKSIVMKLVEELGFDAVDAGSLNDSWRQQPGTPVYCTNLTANEVRKALSGTDRKRSQRIRKIAEQKLTQLSPDSPPDVLVKLSRSLQEAA